MVATLTKPKAITVALFELHNSGKPERVDVEGGVIKGVKIVGVQSRNTARVLGLNARDFGGALDKPYTYARAALKRAIPKYENARVRFDHPDHQMKDGKRVIPSFVRPAISVSGQLQNVRMVETGSDETDGLYGDLVLIKSHPHSAFVLEVADKMPDALCLSHNAAGRPVLENGRVVIDEILSVRSVDIIGGGDGGTTHGLFESSLATDEVKPMGKNKELYESMASVQELRSALLAVIDGDGDDAAKLEELRDMLSGAEPAAGDSSAMESMALIESCGREVTAIRVQAVAALGGEESRKALIETWPKKGSSRSSLRPAFSQPANPLLENFAQAQNVGDFVSSCQL